jgi:hypothetical protein
MSAKELSRLEIMQRLKEKRLTQKGAASQLGLSTRQIKRLWRAYQQGGAPSLISQRRGKPSNHQLKSEVVQQALDLIREKYVGFGPTLAHEKLTEVDHLSLSRESVRRIQIAENLWKPKHTSKPSVHPMRERRACLGELVQIDGSEHAWFEDRGPKCTLLVFIDDATGQLLELRFVTHESFFSYCEACRLYFERCGKPVAFYTDKLGVFHVNQPQTIGQMSGLTQFGRAMQELDIQILCANSPQAKGRVERANQTLQDRLVKELRLHAISNMEAGNAFLPDFIQDFNRRFAVVPRSAYNAHRLLLPNDDLAHIFTWQEERVLSKNLTLQYHKRIYQIQSTRPGYALRKAHVLVCENAQGGIQILYQNQPLVHTLFLQSPHQADVVDTKNINAYLRPSHSPAADHPWRLGFGYHLNGKPIQDANSHGPD